MLLIHLSDVHLKSSDYNNILDPNQLLRERLKEDLSYMCEKLDEVPSAIIISGDIAYSGQESEYVFAKEWLLDLCHEIGVDYSILFVIPGNHDVDRNVFNNAIGAALIDKFRSSNHKDLEQDLIKIICDSEVSEKLVEQIKNFNHFAKDFSCDIDFKKKLHAERKLDLGSGISINLWGLNSVIVSNIQDSESERNMFVVPSYRTILEKPKEINIVICHHPHNWLGNGKEFFEHITATSQVLLFGHEHENRFLNSQDYIQVAASAVIPDRDGGRTSPGYNLLKFTIEEINHNPVVHIDLYMREWQKNPPKFRGKQPKDNSDFLRHTFNVNRTSNYKKKPDKEIVNSLIEPTKTKLAELVEFENKEDDGDGVVIERSSVVMSFMELLISERRDLAVKCGVDISEFKHLNDKEFSIRVLSIILEADKINILAEELKNKHKDQ